MSMTDPNSLRKCGLSFLDARDGTTGAIYTLAAEVCERLDLLIRVVEQLKDDFNATFEAKEDG